MIEHKYAQVAEGRRWNTDKVQAAADAINRQEVTAEWFWENGVDADMALWAWVIGNEPAYGLDPWRLIEMDQIKPHYRLFVQRNQLAKADA